MKFTGVVGFVGSYFSFCSFTTILNLTVVTFAGSFLSVAWIATIFSSTVAFLATIPDNVWINGDLSVALSLEVIPFPVTPFGNADVVKLAILLVLSEAFIVTLAFSPRYTVTFGKPSLAVPSDNGISIPSSPTNFTIGLTVSFTLSVTGIILYGWTRLAFGPVSDTLGNVTFT